MSDRPFDLVLFGATGFTGTLVAEYVARHGPRDLRWAIAGRSREKLEAVRRDLGLGDLPIEIADSHDDAALGALASRTRVVCTTVGPFAKHGIGLVRAAAKNGTHYCDITGETQFVRRSIDEHHDDAVRTKARIVHCCGFDSIPFDLGVYMLWDHAKKNGEKGLRWAKGFCGATKGGMSGGTIASMVNIMEEATRDRDVRRLIGDPHGLDPVRSGRTVDPFEQDQRGVRWDADIERWTAPFVMAAINTRIVRRSNALVGYGEGFRYHESMSMPKGPKGLVAAAAISAGLGGMMTALAIPFTRNLLAERVLPKPGEGPSKEARDKGYFKVRIVAETEGGKKLHARVEGTSDPGYGETAKMLGESALCLAKDDAKLPPVAGVLTPASAMDMALVERLRAASMTFVVEG